MPDGRRLFAEFDAGERLLHAAEAFRDRGYTKLDAHTPFPLHGLEEALGLRRSYLPRLVFAGGMVGAGLAFLVQWWTSAVAYKLNSGGRPAFNPPSFVPITFEMGVLGAALTAVVGVLVLNRLPRLSHPVFDIEGFERATVDRFWLVVDADDPKFEDGAVRGLLAEKGALRVVSLGGVA